MSFFLAVLGFAAVVLAFIGVERLYRSPSKPKWIDYEMVVMMISVVFTGSIAGGIGAVVATALDLPFPIWQDGAVALATVIAVVVVARFVFRAVSGVPGAPAL